MFFGIGLVLGGVGLTLAQPLLVFLGTGVVSGIGCGLNYIAPVSTHVTWFPDRRGMATGLASLVWWWGIYCGIPERGADCARGDRHPADAAWCGASGGDADWVHVAARSSSGLDA